MQAKQSPVALILNPNTMQQSVTPGSTLELYVTVSNQGPQSAVIDLFIDEASQTLRQWCETPRERLALGPQQSSEVVFRFQIPVQAFPGIYDYVLVVDAPQHYPEDTPIQRPRQIQVLPQEQAAVKVNDPTFSLKPITSPAQPAVLKLGQPLPIQVLVHNRSDRVDRFRVSCPDLEEDWFTVRYAAGLEGPGLLTGNDGLGLNPGAQGPISLLFQPPLNTLAGSYSPTIRVHSTNNSDLVLLDLVYIQIPAFYRLNVELNTLLGKVTRSAGQYELKLTNEGNTIRELSVRAKGRDEEDLCTYTCEPESVRVLPGKTTSVSLQVKPTKWWRQPLYGNPLDLNFQIELEDSKQLALPKELPQGLLIWQPRPWWQLLLLAFSVFVAILALVLLIWQIYFKAPEPPKLLPSSFQPDSSQLSEAAGDSIQLNWQIRNPDQIQKITIAGKAGPATQTVTYDFSKGIPKGLEAQCQTLEKVLTCSHVATDAKQAGKYIFEIQVFPRNGEPPLTQPTDLIDIKPKPPKKVEPLLRPKIIFFELNGINAPAKVSLPIKTPTLPGKGLNLTWKIEGKETTIEIPPYGTFGTTGKLVLPPYQQVTGDTITLKAVNKAGQVTRGFAIETYDPTPSPPVSLPPLAPIAPVTPPPSSSAPKPAAALPSSP
jgi:hypothetical protein